MNKSDTKVINRFVYIVRIVFPGSVDVGMSW